MIDTARLHLRKPTPDDITLGEAFYASDRSRFVGGPADTGTYWRLFAAFLGHWQIRGYGLFVVSLRDTGRAIGLIGPWYPGDWPDHELGWQLWHDKDRGHGYATEAASASLDWTRATLGWRRVVSYIAPDNLASVAVATRLGAQEDATLPHPPNRPCRVFRHRDAP